ncbi:MAG: cobyric acid synthase [Acidimicrobiia bacterium]|nr:cobyric acid synthase [Acidimicrobiia bacterium]
MSGLLVCGTSSGAGKSTVVTALCRSLARRGVRVAPFKAQNMSNQSAVTADGAEIGRAQYAQAQAAGVEPEAAMNPVLLKPTGERTAQVVIGGRAVGTTDATGWRPDIGVALDAVATLADRFDIVIAEGAGSCAELNLLARDIANLPLAHAAGWPALLVADIDRGGVYASVAGTLAVLPPELRACLRAVVVNKLRGDPAVFDTALLAAVGLPVLGVLPWLDGRLPDEEDSLDLRLASAPAGATLDVVVIRWPRIANATDLEPLLAEPGVAVREVVTAAQLGCPHLVVLPGTKATVADLAWLRATGLAAAVASAGGAVLGICGGLQVLGRWIDDAGVESGAGRTAGLGLLDLTTTFHPDKLVRRHPGGGYELRHGRLDPEGDWFESADGRVWGTPVHGRFDDDRWRAALLGRLAQRVGVGWTPSGRSWDEHRRTHHDRLADWLEAAVDVDALVAMMAA